MEKRPAQSSENRRSTETDDVNSADSRLDDQLRDFADRTMDELLRLAALSQFYRWPEDPRDPALLEYHNRFFQAWFFSCWTYRAEEFPHRLRFPPGTTIIEYFCQHNKVQLSTHQLGLLKARNRVPLQYWWVIESRPGKGMVLEAIASGIRLAVSERSASRCTRPGDILLAQLICHQERHHIAACAPFALPLWRCSQIQRLVNQQATSFGQARTDTGGTLRDYYFRVLTTRPVMKIIDGESICKLQKSPSRQLLIQRIFGLIHNPGKQCFGYLMMDRALTLLEDILINDWFPMQRGRPEIWAAALMLALFQVNASRRTRQRVSLQQLLALFNVNHRTVTRKAAFIRKHCPLAADLPENRWLAHVNSGQIKLLPAHRQVPLFQQLLNPEGTPQQCLQS